MRLMGFDIILLIAQIMVLARLARVSFGLTYFNRKKHIDALVFGIILINTCVKKKFGNLIEKEIPPTESIMILSLKYYLYFLRMANRSFAHNHTLICCN